MKLKRTKKILLIVIIIFIFLFGSAYALLKANTYSPSVQALLSNETAIKENNYDLYINKSLEQKDTAIIFYPGALVKGESYSLWSQLLANQGYPVYVVHFPLNLAILNSNAAAKIIEQGKYQNYILAGHSLGGVAASTFTHENQNKVAGLLYLASYPQSKDSLATSKIPVLSITGSNDGVLNIDAYNNAKQYLPDTTQYTVIDGGNHGGFGSYGQQKGDNEATISNIEQQKEIATIISEWLVQNFK